MTDDEALGMAEGNLRAYVEEFQSRLMALKARNEELESRNAAATEGMAYNPTSQSSAPSRTRCASG